MCISCAAKVFLYFYILHFHDFENSDILYKCRGFIMCLFASDIINVEDF